MADVPTLGGLIVPIVLPLTAEGRPHVADLGALVDRFAHLGVHGIWANGSTGEVNDLGVAERAAVIREIASATSGRGPVVAHVADTSTKLAIAHATAAADAGATHIAAVPPYYAQFDDAEIGDYYRALAQATDLPLLLYNLPQMVQASLAHDTVLDLAAHGIAIGLKDSAGDFTWYRELLRRLDERGVPLRCFMGAEPLADVSLYAGGAGLVCTLANLVPRAFLDIGAAADTHDWDTARRRQRDVLALIDAMRLPGRSTWIGSVAALKWLMHELEMISTPTVAAPLRPLDDDERKLLTRRALPLAAALH